MIAPPEASLLAHCTLTSIFGEPNKSLTQNYFTERSDCVSTFFDTSQPNLKIRIKESKSLVKTYAYIEISIDLENSFYSNLFVALDQYPWTKSHDSEAKEWLTRFPKSHVKCDFSRRLLKDELLSFIDSLKPLAKD